MAVFGVWVIFSQASQNSLFQIDGYAGNYGGRRFRLGPQDGAQRVSNGGARKCTNAGHHLVQHRPEAEDVASGIHPSAAGLLRRHIRRSPGNRPRRAQRHIRCVRQRRFIRAFTSTQFGQTEVEHLHGTIRADHDVGRFQIAMDDAARVRSGQSVCDRNGNTQHLSEPHPVPRNECIEALPANVLHHDEVDAVGGLDFVNRDDVRVIEG